MKLYNERELLFLEMGVSGVNLEPGLLKIKERMNSLCDEAPDNTALHPIAFTRKSLPSVEMRYSNIEMRVLNILH